MKTEIKYTSGDKVYWLSSKGFQKGIVKQVVLIDSISTNGNENSNRHKNKEVKYFLWHEKNATVYQGDEVKENEIFTSYEEMIKYYSNKKM